MRRALFRLIALASVVACTEPQTTAEVIVPEWHVAADPTVHFGGDDNPASPLFKIAGLARLEGRIFVVNAGEPDFRIYSEDGRLVSSFGRGGDGPGEVRSPKLVSRHPGDSLIIHDGVNQRLSAICGGTHLCAEWSVAIRGSVLGIAGDLAFIERFRGGSLGERLTRDSYSYLAYRFDGSVLDTIFSAEGVPRLGDRVGGRWMSLPVPLTGVPSAAVSESALVVNNGRDAVLRIFGSNGLEQRSVTLPISLEPVTAPEFRDLIEGMIGRYPAQDQPGVRRFFEAMPPPPYHPTIRRILVDRTGLIWVERWQTDAALHSWIVSDLQGQTLAQVTTPRRLTVEEIGVDYVLGVWRDSLDVEYVRMHTLSRE